MEPVLPRVWVCMFALSTLDKSTITNIYGTLPALTHRWYFPLEYINTITEIYIWLRNAIFDEERRALSYADRRTTWYIWASLHRKDHRSWTPDKRHQRGLNNHSYVQKPWPRNAPYIHTKYQTICPSSTAWESATQNKYHSKLESNAAQLQWSSTEPRVQQPGRIDWGGSIQIPSPPPLQQNRKSINKGWLTVKISNKHNFNIKH